MGTGGWGKSACESLKVSSQPFIYTSWLDWPGRTLNVPIPSLIGVRDGPEHAKRRRTWNRGFSPASMRDYEPMVRERVLGLSKAIAQRGRVDLSIIFGYLTSVSIITDPDLTLTSPTRFDVMADMG